MKRYLMSICFVALVTTTPFRQESWAGDPDASTTVLVAESPVDAECNQCPSQVIIGGNEKRGDERTILEKLELGDGVYMPRFIGEQMIFKAESEKKILVVDNPEITLRIYPWDNSQYEIFYSNLDTDLGR